MEKTMKISFVYYHCGERKSAKDILLIIRKHHTEYKFRAWTRKSFRSWSVLFTETLQIEVKTLHTFQIENIKNSMGAILSCPVSIRIDGKTLIQYCAWAQYRLRKIERTSKIEI